MFGVLDLFLQTEVSSSFNSRQNVHEQTETLVRAIVVVFQFVHSQTQNQLYKRH